MSDGPLRSKDFRQAADTQHGGWWDWKPARHALEHLFLSGQLMVSHREGFQKVFDLTERVLPGDIDSTMPGAVDAVPSRVRKKDVTFLSPFDQAVIDRTRTRDLFAFDYQIECYVPEKKRQYGYFCLPMLWGDELIGRMDAKTFRDAGHFLVRGLFLEPKVRVDDSLKEAIHRGKQRLAEAHGCSTVELPRLQRT